MPIYNPVGDVSAGCILSGTYLNPILDDLYILSKHDHSPSLGEGNNIVTSASDAGSGVPEMTWFVEKLGGVHSVSGNNLPQAVGSASMIGGVIWGFNVTDLTQSATNWYRFRLPLIKGVYTFQIMYIPQPTGAVAQVTINACVISNLDTYAVSQGSPLYHTASGISVSSTGSQLLQITLSASNTAASSGCMVYLGIWNIRKTAHT